MPEDYGEPEEGKPESKEIEAVNVMHVQVKVKCAKCGKEKEIEVPVVCEPGMEQDKEKLICDIVGNLQDYVPECECGGKFEKVEEPGREYR